jgi:hypothetical protein
MFRHQISQDKMNALRKQFIAGDSSGFRIAKQLGISTVTSWRYMLEFKRIQAAYPERLKDMDFYMPEGPRPHWPTTLYVELMKVLPRLLEAEKPGVKAKPVWRKYKQICPAGYTYLPFTTLFYQWIAEHDIPRKPNLLASISQEDLKVFKKWRSLNDHRKWQIATTLIMATQTSVFRRITEKTEATHATITGWLDTYRLKGPEGFELPKHKIAAWVTDRMRNRAINLIKLLHESPKVHGLNRTSWSITALAAKYGEVYSDKISWGQAAYTLKKNGYGFKKSRDTLTSKDPKFREKVNKIQRILQRLRPDEKFFSIDEYGPVGIKIKGGWMLKKKDESYRVPDKQKNKGIVICTAALELSANQVSHFFSAKKNTFETIKMIEFLISQYADQRRIYICWDNVSWHRSRILTNFIEDHNRQSKPEIRLAPLPSCTQFLNVIESVFGGLARTVIHNSNYDSVSECQVAITRYFEERNRHFKENPKRAGKKLWGKEPVVPKFDESQNCRNRRAMRGAVLQTEFRPGVMDL